LKRSTKIAAGNTRILKPAKSSTRWIGFVDEVTCRNPDSKVFSKT